jgi:hypothetical protein
MKLCPLYTGLCKESIASRTRQRAWAGETWDTGAPSSTMILSGLRNMQSGSMTMMICSEMCSIKKGFLHRIGKRVPPERNSSPEVSRIGCSHK